MIKVNLSEQQLQALEVCAQLLEVGTFQLGGKDIVVAYQARQILAELIQEAKAPSPNVELVEDQTPTKAARAVK